MSLISIVMVLIIVGVLLGLVNVLIPMPSSIKTIINVVVVATVILWVLQAFGIVTGIPFPKL